MINKVIGVLLGVIIVPVLFESGSNVNAATVSNSRMKVANIAMMKKNNSSNSKNDDNLVSELSKSLTKDKTLRTWLNNNKGKKISPEIFAELLYTAAFERSAIAGGLPLEPGEDDPYANEFNQAQDWFKNIPKEQMSVPFTDIDGEVKNLNAYYLKNSLNSNKTVIIDHGYRGQSLDMGAWVKLYYDMGYNVLVPDARAHGSSDGNDISFGWKEKGDSKNWVNKLVEMNSDVEIIMTGVSMGGSTTMMASGEGMPSNVKAYIEDCGYSSLYDEFKYLKPYIIKLLADSDIDITDEVFDEAFSIASNKLEEKQGFTLQDVSSVNQLANNVKPMLFIHGDNDTFVPTEMVYDNYNSTRGERKLWVVPNATHAMSIARDLLGYQQHVSDFLENIIK